jgi:hypothetical protein
MPITGFLERFKRYAGPDPRKIAARPDQVI